MTERYTVHEDESGKFHYPTWWVEDLGTKSLAPEFLGPFDSEESAQEEADDLNKEETALCHPMKKGN